MDNASYIALSRQIALHRNLDVVANNLANTNTAAYKRESLLFREYLGDRLEAQPISYVHDDAVMTDTTNGALTQTGNPLDFGIDGEGYFTVETPVGARYTRDGRFTRDAEGDLVTKNGYPVLDDGGDPIRLPDADVTLSVTPEGVLQADGIPMGRLGLVRFEQEQALLKTQSGIYKTDQPELPADEARVIQGSIEESNVEPIIEMTRMIQILRAYQSTQQLIDAEHDRITTAIRELPRVDQA